MATGEKELFLKLWDERERVSVISGKSLKDITHPNWHWQMSHLLPKSIYGKFRLNPDNIVFMTEAEHEWWGTYTEASKRKAIYQIYRSSWDKLFEKRDRLKELYHTEKNHI